MPRDVVNDVLEVARWSGSAMNVQPWELVVVRDRGALGALARAEGYAGHLAGAALGLVVVMARGRAEQEAFDEGRLSERVMLAAAAHGVGSSIGWFARGGRDAVKETLGIPQGRTVRTAISLGYSEAPSPRGRSAASGGRKPLSEIVREERYA